MDNAKDTMQVIEILEKIDVCIDEAITTTYKNIKATPKHWWLEDIHHANLLVQYWSALTSMLCSNTFAIDTLTFIHSKLLLVFDIYKVDNNSATPAQLQKAKKA
eukprot:15366354-Ditylum_brightwellii.AAC.2